MVKKSNRKIYLLVLRPLRSENWLLFIFVSKMDICVFLYCLTHSRQCLTYVCKIYIYIILKLLGKETIKTNLGKCTQSLVLKILVVLSPALNSAVPENNKDL